MLEGGGAWEIRQAMDARGKLLLVDPYRLGRLGVNLSRVIARRLVEGMNHRGQVVWIRKTSQEAAANWEEPIDFLFLDGLHSFEAVQTDWKAWSPHVRPGGSVALRRDLAGRPADPDRADLEPVGIVEWALATDRGWELRDERDTIAVLTREGTKDRSPA